LSKTEFRARAHDTDVNCARNVQTRAFMSEGERWSAASEGVLAALRLSKSTQSADKVHFSDSSELPEGRPRRLRAV